MQPSDQPTTVPAPAPGNRSRRFRRFRRMTLAVALGGGLALGGAGLAYADDASAVPPAPSSAAPSSAAPSAGPPAVKVNLRPHLDGTVREIGSGKIMITDRDGFTRQINIASAPAGVVVGTRVHAEGTVNPDGVSLDADSVVVAPERGPDGPDGPRKGGPGGPREIPGPPAPGEKGAPAVPAPVPSGSVAPAPSMTN